MVLAIPTGMSIHSFQFLLKYPKIKSNDPSAFCSQPSYTGAMFKPVVGCCARGTAPAAASAAKHRTPITQRQGNDRLIAVGPRLLPEATWVCRESWRMCRVGTLERSAHQSGSALYDAVRLPGQTGRR